MRTKIIVSGGYADAVNFENAKFFKEILRHTGDKVKILLILFAKPEDAWDTRSKSIINQFDSIKGPKNLEYSVANHDELEDQIDQSDIIYIRGGDTTMLIEAIEKHPDFIDHIKGKIVAGESAGTYLLSKCFYSKTIQSVRNGLGVIHVKAICHFEGKDEDRLDECPDNLEKLLLNDFKHKVYFV